MIQKSFPAGGNIEVKIQVPWYGRYWLVIIITIVVIINVVVIIVIVVVVVNWRASEDTYICHFVL